MLHTIRNITNGSGARVAHDLEVKHFTYIVIRTKSRLNEDISSPYLKATSSVRDGRSGTSLALRQAIYCW